MIMTSLMEFADLQQFRSSGDLRTVPYKKRYGRSGAAHLSYVKNTERNSLNAIEIALHLKAMTDEFRIYSSMSWN